MKFPIGKLEKAEPFTDIEYISGPDGLDNIVEGVIFINAVQGCEYISERDLVILGDNDWYMNAEGQDTLKKRAIEKGFSGIVFYNASFIEMPDRIRAIGEDLKIPIILAGDVTRTYTYSEISDYFSENYYIQTSGKFLSKDLLLKKFYQCAEDEKVRCIMDKLWCYTGLEVFASYKGEEIRFGRKEHIQAVIENKDHWVRIEPEGLLKKERIDSYYLETSGEEYYILVSGFDSDSVDDLFLLISKEQKFNPQDIKVFFYSLLALDVDNKKKLAGFADRHQEVITMLYKGVEEDTTIREALDKYNISIKESNLVIVFNFKIEKMNIRKLFYDLLNLMQKKKIEGVTPLIGLVDEQLVIILPAEVEEQKTLLRIASMVENYASGNEKGIGGYAAMEQFINLSKMLKRARQALLWALRGQQRGLVNYDGLGVLKYIGDMGASQFTSEGGVSSISKVIAYDHENDTELFQTLQSYIKNLGSVSRASRELFISINTVKYRIAQIENLLHMELNKVEDRAVIEVEIQMHKMMHI